MALGNVTRALKLRGEIGSLRGELRKLGRFGALVGASPPMQKVYDLIDRVAGTDASILISGETGTGKELVAETIHGLSRRSKEPFLASTAGPCPRSLIESELFGHERGSFTGADRMHKGYFERADGGTLFLDEITEMPSRSRSGCCGRSRRPRFTRVGGSEEIKLDVRVVAATNRRVDEAVAAGKLREDLYLPAERVPDPLPPLRERGDDIELLAENFLGELNQRRVRPSTSRARAWSGSPARLARQRARAAERRPRAPSSWPTRTWASIRCRSGSPKSRQPRAWSLGLGPRSRRPNAA